MIKQNEIKVLLMANVHGGNLHLIELAPCKYIRVYFYFGVQKKLIT
jgi:hypothetical protein